MKPETLNDIFRAIIARRLERVIMVRDESGWRDISAQELQQSVTGTASALRELGIAKGDRVAILSENRPEWAIADFACLQLGAVVVPIYATLNPQQVATILCDSGCRVIFVSTARQVEKVRSIKEQTFLEHVIVMDAIPYPDARAMRSLLGPVSAEQAGQIEELARSVSPNDLASIIYTSGTTGVPKGAMLSHGNLTSNIRYSLSGFDVGPGQISISFLPLSHVTARHADIALLHCGVTLAYCPNIEDVPKVLREVRPQILVSVPRIYEKIYTQVQQSAKGFAKSAIYRWAVAVGRAHRPEILAGKTPRSLRWRMANKLLYAKIRARLGGRVQFFVSGGAPLGRELAEWFADIGIRIHEGYGLTETSPVIALNSPLAHRVGSVGRPLPNVEVRTADDSEILVRGPSIFCGYWKLSEETSNSFVDGWFKTGDIGHLDQDGFLFITDRKKDLLKTSGGKFIAPQPIENSLKLNSLIAAAVVLGDRRKFPSVIIAPHFPLLEEWAHNNQIACNSRDELVAHSKVRALYEEMVGKVNRNLSRHEMLKKVLLVPHEFTATDGSLTPSMKIRRRVIEERYSRQITELYEEPPGKGQRDDLRQ